MGLTTYKEKRNFRRTPEPAGHNKKEKSELIFVIQRHKASHLHYDFRLELDGVLKSWAVPKGPSMNPSDKRLAMMVEDHPFDYKDFEGIIPEGNYGAGIVEIWDEGTYSAIDASDKKDAEKKLRAGLQAGSLKITVKGKKLKGEFALVKTKGRGENAWLLIKHRDKHAVDEPYSSEEHTPKNSPINKWLREHKKPTKKYRTGTSNEKTTEVAAPLKKKVRAPLVSETRKVEGFIKPMLARETDKPFSDASWIYEIKWDGFRAIAECDGQDVKLYSRNGNSFYSMYPDIIESLQKMNLRAVIDGEIAVLDENGRSNFQLLQYYGSDSSFPLSFRVFDILELDGKNKCNLPLTERKQLLKKIIKKNDVVRYSDHIDAEGEAFFEAAVSRDLEGIIAKKADSLYYPGVRTNEWLKIKHHKTQEAIIAGFTEPTGGRKHFGSLVLAQQDGDKLKYIGNSGSGFNEASLREVKDRMEPLIQEESPFAERVKASTPITWVKPVLVCEVKYSEITRDGKMRHPIFLHLREDKKPAEVTKEAAQPVKKPAGAAASKEKKPAKKGRKENARIYKFGKNEVRVTNPTKIFWPEEGLTKGDVAEYYISVSKYILPYLKDRPQSLLRNPNGIKDKGFFHKDAGEDVPSYIATKVLYSESAKKDIDYIVCNNQATLTYLNNLGCIEINPWHSTVQQLDHPDYLIIDIDPSDKNTFEQVIDAALVVREILQQAGAPAFCKTSGATGLHIYVPTKKKYTYDQLKDFAHIVCMLTNEQLPSFTSLERNLKKRGNKMIYLDHLQNRRGQTISSVYSLRPRPGATVSMPLDWKEVKHGLSPRDFTIYNALKRIKKKGDIFSGIFGKGIDLEKCLTNLGA